MSNSISSQQDKIDIDEEKEWIKFLWPLFWNNSSVRPYVHIWMEQ